MLASNFRFSTEDVECGAARHPWPDWLRTVIERITAANGWADDWFNDAVAFHLSLLADRAAIIWSSAPSRGHTGRGLVVSVPSAPTSSR